MQRQDRADATHHRLHHPVHTAEVERLKTCSDDRLFHNRNITSGG
jgi:hypothetical protein